MEDIRKYYEGRVNNLSTKIASLKKAANLLSFMRLLAFILFGFALYYAIGNKFDAQILMTFLSVFLLILFAILISMHLRVIKRKTFHEQLLNINKNEINVLDGKPSNLNDGTVFSNSDNYSTDLDIFGKGSLYQLLNRCGTSFGRSKLASRLQKTFLEKEKIHQEQKATQELAKHKELRQLILALLLNEKEDKDKTLESIKDYTPKFNSSLFWKAIVWVWPALFISFTVYSYIANIWGLWTIAFFLGWGILGTKLKSINYLHNLVTRKSNYLTQFAKVFKLLSETEFHSERMKELQKEMLTAHKEFNKLNSLVNRFDIRLNQIVGLLMNSFFFLDIHNSIAVERWIQKNKIHLPIWFDTLGEVETINSLATFYFNNPEYIFPEISEELSLKVEELGHPLIKKKERINNSYEIGPYSKVHLITGSNMTGKTTFLRTLGINLVLAQSGAPVCSKLFKFTPMTMYSSIRNTDSLQENTSLFYAELNRLKSIIEAVAKGKPTFILLDEILKGTNHDDKFHGSQKVAERLTKYNCLAIMATHDTKLGELEEIYKGVIKNYHFDSQINGDELSFDYKIKNGVSQNRNASFLMRQLGII